MARVTVEDCVLEVPNRFELVVLASRRAKDIASGSTLTVERDNDKDAVVALREIAEKTVSPDVLREEVVQGLQRRIKADTPEEEVSNAQDARKSEIAEEVEELTIKDSRDEGLLFGAENLDVED